MADIQKTYQYQVYKGADFLGILQNVTTDFNYAQDINSNAVQIAVDVDITADVADTPVTAILDETGNAILDEAGDPLYEERALDVVGGLNPSALIQEDNILKVYEISAVNPNGRLVFDGYIENWNALMGSSDDKISFTAVSKGVDLVEYLVEGARSTDITSAGLGAFGMTLDTYFGQTLLVGSGITNISAMQVGLSRAFGSTHSQVFTLRLYNSPAEANAGATPLATATATVTDINPSGIDTTFNFASQITVVPLQQYFFVVTCGDSEGGIIMANNPGTYANGNGYVRDGTATSFQLVITPASSYGDMDLRFKTFYTSGATSTPFSSQDPAVILQTVIDNYRNLGGIINYGVGTVDLTGLSVSYTFKVNTILEAIQKCLDLAPYNWYWYVDPATSVLYFKQTPTTPTHKFIKGRHFNQIQIGGTVENVRNVVYFSGGDDGSGSNLFRKYTNLVSLAVRRRRLDRLSDNRVTLTATADLIANNFLNEHPNTEYNSPVTIIDGTYDISTINVGDTVLLEGFGNFADTLTLQIARLMRYPDRIDLTLGIILQRQSDALVEALNQLDALQTVDNPSTPS